MYKQRGAGFLTFLFLLLCLLIFAALTGQKERRQTYSKQQEADAALEAQQREQDRQQLIDDFLERKTEILQGIKDDIKVGHYTAASMRADSYAEAVPQDVDLQAITQEAREKDLYHTVQKIPAKNMEQNLMLYERLLELRPDKELYRQKVAHYQEKQNIQLAEEQKRIIKFGEPPIKGLGGYYYPVKRYLEGVAHDPDSINLEGCTSVFHTTNGWLVGCVFRGRNAFGAKIKNANWFTIRHARVVKMEEGDAYEWR